MEKEEKPKKKASRHQSPPNLSSLFVCLSVDCVLKNISPFQKQEKQLVSSSSSYSSPQSTKSHQTQSTTGPKQDDRLTNRHYLDMWPSLSTQLCDRLRKKRQVGEKCSNRRRTSFLSEMYFSFVVLVIRWWRRSLTVWETGEDLWRWMVKRKETGINGDRTGYRSGIQFLRKITTSFSFDTNKGRNSLAWDIGEKASMSWLDPSRRNFFSIEKRKTKNEEEEEEEGKRWKDFWRIFIDSLLD